MLIFTDNCEFFAGIPATDASDGRNNGYDRSCESVSYAMSSGCLVTRHDNGGDISFEYPVASECIFDTDIALNEIESYCAENYIPIVFSFVNEDKIGILEKRYNRAECVEMSEKDGQKLYMFRPLSEIFGRTSYPELTTERLTLSLLSDFDAREYDRLCRDETINRFWGYDYRTDCPFPAPDYFIDDVMNDLNDGISVSYSVKIGGEFAGECVFYGFNCRGTANVGIRLFESAQEKGIGSEAFARFLAFGFDSLGLSQINAKCYRENIPAFKMLSRCMTQCGSDGEYCLFALKK